MPGPCSQPPLGKTKTVRQSKVKGAEPRNGYPANLKARIDNMPKDANGFHFNRPGSYKK